MNRRKTELLMANVSLAWGSSYLLIKVVLHSINPFNLIALRFGIAFICMMILFFPHFRKLNWNTLGKGMLMGSILF
ncbi:EamA family transporter [Eisenbergiella sp.]